LAVNDGDELGQLVDLALGGTPVVAGKRSWPSCLVKSPMEVIDLDVGNVEMKRVDLHRSIHISTLAVL
jgi:hypothetical protein